MSLDVGLCFSSSDIKRMEAVIANYPEKVSLAGFIAAGAMLYLEKEEKRAQDQR